MITSLRTLAIAAVSSLGLVIYMVLWFRWPLTLSLGLGALIATVVVMTSASFGADAGEAEAAWRAAAPDLVDQSPETRLEEADQPDAPNAETGPDPEA